METINNDEAYKYLVQDILDNKEFSKLSYIAHHGMTRLDHSLKVSYYSYKISKFLKLDFRETARAGLLHDFYLNRTKDYKKFRQKFKLYTTGHPKNAVENSSRFFYLSEKEKDIIKTHMFPLDFRIPKYLEGWVVNMVDTVVSIIEFTKKFSYQLNTALNVWLILIMNIRR
ncbi:MAG: hypothetical protein IJO32_05955 [Bacilli bacterium]|nr:hypothetical protein [Bacilli bacterium]